MSQPDVLELAKQGNPRAIAAIVNHLAKPYHITAKATRQEDCLHILLESEQAISQPTAVALIYKIVSSLKSESIRAIRVYGRQVGEKAATWYEEISLITPEADLPGELEQNSSPEAPESEEIIQADVPVSESSIMAQNNEPTFSIAPEQVELPATLPANPEEAETASPEEMTETDIDQSDQSETIALLQKPESFILITFALVWLLWETYMSFMSEAEAEQPTAGKGFAPKPNGSERPGAM
jgi:uncharacterized glyoxalase superfamily protein PhnB